MAKYVTEIAASRSDAEEKQLKSKGFDKIDVDLNKGALGQYVYLWYKRGDAGPITRVQVSFNDQMSAGLTAAGYKKLPDDLNARAGGDYIHLWYYSGSTEYDTPVVDLTVTLEASEEAPLYRGHWQRVGCDLNRKAGGKYIYAWVKRERPTYICDVLVTDKFAADADHFKAGYVRVDEDLNRGAGGAWVFLWYRQTTDSGKGLCRLAVSTDDKERKSFAEQGYTMVDGNLSEGAGKKEVYLWCKQGDSSIQALSVLVNKEAVDLYKKAGLQVVQANLNSGNSSLTEVYLAYY